MLNKLTYIEIKGRKELNENIEIALSDEQNKKVALIIYSFLDKKWELICFRSIKYGPSKADILVIIGFAQVDKRSKNVLSKSWRTINYWGDITPIEGVENGPR